MSRSMIGWLAFVVLIAVIGITSCQAMALPAALP